MTHPSIAQAYAAKRATAIKHVPFGVLLADDRTALIKATARDCGVNVEDVLKEVENG